MAKLTIQRIRLVSKLERDDLFRDIPPAFDFIDAYYMIITSMMSRKTKDDRTGRILRKSYWSASRRLFFFGVFLITLVIATMIGQVSYSKPDPNGGTNTNNNQNQNQGNNQNNNNQNQGGNNQNQNGGNSNGGSNGGGGGSGGGSTCGSAHTFFDWGCNGVDDKDSILTVLVTISNWLAAGVVIAVIGGIIYGAIMYATSAGDAAKAKSATEIIRNAFIALILYFLMWAFLQYIVPGGLFN
ncbi:hypothetical protein G51EAM_00193 [Candidatus Nanoperiomorbus periodonticus]|nr:hypothetical protein G51EAM_00193 [Candidatus Nanoperiomorbus periodonticus]